jgi:hypothetical protein
MEQKQLKQAGNFLSITFILEKGIFMSVIGNGKCAEGILITAAMLSERIGAATIYYNGQPYTNASGYGFDTQPFEDCMIEINVGTVQGAVATLINDVYECATDDPSSATELSGANFTDVNSSNDEQVRRGAIQCRDTKRYLFLRTESQGTPLTIDFGAQWIGGNPRSQETEQVLEFDV